MNAQAHVFPIYASMIADKTNVPVKIEGSEAYYDGEVLHLPALPLDDGKIAQAAWGYQYLEVGKINESDEEIIKSVSNNPFRRALLDVIEEIRVVNVQSGKYLTSNSSINSMHERIFQLAGHHAPTVDDHPSIIFLNHILYFGLNNLANLNSFEFIWKYTESIAWQTFGPNLIKEIEALISDDMKLLTCTRDSLFLTDTIIKLLHFEEENAESEEQSTDSAPSSQSDDNESNDSDQSQDNGDDKDDEGEVESKSNELSEDESESEDSSQTGDTGDENDELDDDREEGTEGDNSKTEDENSSDSEDEGKSKDSAEDQANSQERDESDENGNSNEEPDSKDKSKALNDTLNANQNDLPKDPLDTLKQEFKEKSESSDNYSVSEEVGEINTRVNTAIGYTAYDTALIHSKGPQKKLKRLLEGSDIRRNSLRNSGLRIDQNRMHRAMSGDSFVFQHKNQITRTNAAVHILLDTSTSMDGDLITALESCLSLGLALESVRNTNLAITRFPVPGTDSVQPLLKPKERIANNVDRFNIQAKGGTPIVEAMWYAYGQLCMQPNDKKVLFVITDGQLQDEQVVGVNKIVSDANKYGVKCAAIGINAAKIEDVFPVSRNLKDVTELENILFDLTSILLTQ